MSERRIDPFTRRGVMIAPARRGLVAMRPSGLPAIEGRCPFCPGHEADTEATVAAWPSEGDWKVRVVANKYPVVERHEVGIDAREHDVDLADLSLEHASAMLRVYRDRVTALERGAGAAVLFRNRGRGAGSSQPHPHTQMAATPWVPSEIALRWRVAEAYHAEHGERLHDAVLREELEDGTRIVASDERAVLLCPRAPSRSFEMRVMLRAPGERFASATAEDVESIAALVVDAHRRLRALGILDVNLVLRQPPTAASGPAAAWHLDVLPRSGGGAGFELSTGEMIVVVPPEEAAAQLR